MKSHPCGVSTASKEAESEECDLNPFQGITAMLEAKVQDWSATKMAIMTPWRATAQFTYYCDRQTYRIEVQFRHRLFAFIINFTSKCVGVRFGPGWFALFVFLFQSKIHFSAACTYDFYKGERLFFQVFSSGEMKLFRYAKSVYVWIIVFKYLKMKNFGS